MCVEPREKGYSCRSMSEFMIAGGDMEGGSEGGEILTRKWNMVKNLPGGMSMWSPNQL